MSARVAAERDAGELAIVLHTHMPYVEGFGTWPFGEEWLWEAVACVYVPLLELLDRGAELTLSLSGVLADQLAAAGAIERCRAFLTGVRAETHRADAAALRDGGDLLAAGAVERAGRDYARAAQVLAERSLASALGERAAWTSSATHAVLPLCATGAGVRLQLTSAIAAHQARTGAWAGGMWLAECAYAAWLEPHLAAAGVQACCVDLTDQFGYGASLQLEPLRSAIGPTLVPIDRATIELVWSERGYPAGGAYRDYHNRSERGHHPWANDGTAYDRDAAREQARADAADFVAAAKRRVSGGGLLVCAFDTELFGHWWYEGIDWLEAVVSEAARAGLALVALDEALARHPPRAVEHGAIAPCTWGTGRDFSSWDCPAAAEIVFAARRAEIELVAASARDGASEDAARALLALQASDWSFLAARGSAGPYPRERVAAGEEAFAAALRDGRAPAGALGNIAPWVATGTLGEP
jgi:1,4-alpha-glucan branching enzyme